MTTSALDSGASRPATPSSWFELHWKMLLLAAIGFAIILAVFIYISITPIPVGALPATTAAMLAIITATAVGIERTIETFWSLIGQFANGWWPFNKVFKEVTELESEVKNQLATAQSAIDDALEKAGGGISDARTRLTQAKQEMEKLQGRLTELEKLAPGNQRVSLIAASISQGLGMITQYQPQIDYNLRLIDQSVAGLTDFVASFKENPARRMISLWAGAMIGLAIAYFMRLDVFFAVLGEAAIPENWWPHLGVALTGLIIGLGSNPTHDVIAALQEVKKYRATQNQPGPASGGTLEAAGETLPPSFGLPATTTPSAPAVKRFR